LLNFVVFFSVRNLELILFFFWKKIAKLGVYVPYYIFLETIAENLEFIIFFGKKIANLVFTSPIIVFFGKKIDELCSLFFS
jgi:hypothetical protein